MRKLLLILLATALASAGCIQNLAGVKENQAPSTDAPLQPAGATLDNTSALANKTPPVARMSIFAAAGALLYKSTFAAEDPSDLVFVDEKTKINLIAGDSEALERGATLAAYAWTLNGKPLENGRQSSAEVGEAGLYIVQLSVTDTNGASDTHTVRLAVAPNSYEVTLEIATGPVAGAEGQGVPASATFEIALDETKPARVQKVVVTAKPDLGLDAVLTVTDAEGTTLGTADGAGHADLDQTETLELGALALGTYTATLTPFAGADPDGIPIVVTITLVPIIAGVNDMDDGHGGHAH